MALVKTNEEIEAGLNSLFKALPKELREQYRWLKPTVEHRLKKLDKLEQEALAKRGLAAAMSNEGRVEDEQASQKTEKRSDKPGRKRQTPGKRTSSESNARKAQ